MALDARRRLSSTAVRELVDFRVLAIEDIGVLRDESPFDGAFSNFSGLNCVDDLPAAARSLARLLKHGARVLLCMSGRFVPMEIAWYLAHGSPRKAMRRIARSGARHPTDDPRVHVHYPSVRVIARAFAPEFRLLGWKGIGVAMPPAYFESWAQSFPDVFDWLVRADGWLGRFPLLRGMARHVLLQFERERSSSPQQAVRWRGTSVNVAQTPGSVIGCNIPRIPHS